MDTYAEVDQTKQSNQVAQSVDNQNTYDAVAPDNLYYNTVDNSTTEDATVYDLTSAPTYSQLDSNQLPRSIHSQRILSMEKISSVSFLEVAGLRKDNEFSNKGKHGTLYESIVVCLILLVIAVAVVFVILIVAFVLIANIHSDIESVMMESANNSIYTSPFMNSLSSLRTNITELESKLHLYLYEMEQKFGVLKNNLSITNKKLGKQANNLTNIQVRAHQIQSEIEMRILEFGSNLRVCLVEYLLNMTTSVNASMELMSNYISSAHDSAQRSVDELTTHIVRDIQELHVFESCDAINKLSLPFSSGEYIIKTSNGSVRMYCTIFSCNGITGGMRRVAYLNTSDPSADQCPGDLERINIIHTLRQSNVPYICRRKRKGRGCSSVVYQNVDSSYSHVCGMINAYKTGSPDGFRDRVSDSIGGNYVDGVSLTHGKNPRNHIWTFVAQVAVNCIECDDQKPNFIDSHYSCDNDRCLNNNICSTGVLWDGDQCIGGAWFYRKLDCPTTDDIEMRVCRSQNQRDEDIRLSTVELYIQ